MAAPLLFVGEIRQIVQVFDCVFYGVAMAGWEPERYNQSRRWNMGRENKYIIENEQIYINIPVECACIIVLTVTGAVLRPLPFLPACVVLALALVLIGFNDYKKRLIPVRWQYLILIAGVLDVAAACKILGMQALRWQVTERIIGMLVLSVPLWLFSKIVGTRLRRTVLGKGDVRMVAMAGAVLGLYSAHAILLATIMQAVVCYFPALFMGKLDKKSYIPAGSFYAIAIWIMYLAYPYFG